jgi:hypothetical protein
MEKLILIFEKDFVDNEFKIIKGEFKIINETENEIIADGYLSVIGEDGEFETAKITNGVYEKKYLNMIKDMEEYKKEINI